MSIAIMMGINFMEFLEKIVIFLMIYPLDMVIRKTNYLFIAPDLLISLLLHQNKIAGIIPLCHALDLPCYIYTLPKGPVADILHDPFIY